MFPVLHTTASARVKALDFSEDGSGLLAVGLYSGEVHVVFADDGRAYRTFAIIHPLPVRAVKFIPSAPVPLDRSAPDCRAAFAPTTTLRHARPDCDGDEAPLASVSAAPCHLAAGCDDMHVYLYDVHGDVLLRRFQAHNDFIRSITLDAASPFVVTTSDDCTARVWTRGFELRQTLQGSTHCVVASAVATLSHCVATDGASLTAETIVATASLDTGVRLWFISGGCDHDSPVASTPCVLHGHTDGVNTVAFVRPTVGRLFVVSGSDDREIRLWDAATHCCVAVLLGHTHSVNAVLCSQHATGTLVSVGSDQRAIQWALSEANDRTWCGGAFTDVETMDIAWRTEQEQASQGSSTDNNNNTLLDPAFLKERAVRDQTDLMMAPSDSLSGPGWAIAATVRDGRVLVAIGTDNGFEVSVRGPSAPQHCSSFVSDSSWRGDCSQLVVGSHPGVVERFDFRDDSVASRNGPGSGDRGSDLSDDEHRPLRVTGRFDSAMRGSACGGLCSQVSRASPAVKVVLVTTTTLALLSVVLVTSFCAIPFLNHMSYLFVALACAGVALMATVLLAVGESPFTGNCLGAFGCVCFCLSFIGFPLCLLHLLPDTFRRLLNFRAPHRIVSQGSTATAGALNFARSLATRRWWRWITTAALAKPVVFVAMCASCTLLPVHIAFVYAASHLSDDLYSKGCTTPECTESRKAVGSAALLLANSAFFVFYCLTAALYIPTVVPVPRASAFLLCAMLLDYTTWVALAVSPTSAPTTAAWVLVCAMVFAPALCLCLKFAATIPSMFGHSRLLNVGITFVGSLGVVIVTPFFVLAGSVFCVGLIVPMESIAPFLTLRSRALFHLFCEDGIPGNAGALANADDVAHRTAVLTKVLFAEAEALEDPVDFPPPPAALFGRKKRVTSRLGGRLITSDPSYSLGSERDHHSQEMPYSTVSESGTAPALSWNPLAQLSLAAATALGDTSLSDRGPPIAPSSVLELWWGLTYLAGREVNAIVSGNRGHTISFTKVEVLLGIVLLPMRFLLVIVVAASTLATASSSGNPAGLLQQLCLAVRVAAAIGMYLSGAAAFLRFAARHVFLLSNAGGRNAEWLAVVAATRDPSSVVVRRAVPDPVVPTVAAMWYVAPFLSAAAVRQ